MLLAVQSKSAYPFCLERKDGTLMRILIADDERDLVAALERVMKRTKYEVDIAYDGIQALEQIHQNQYDCILLDYMMPRLNGLQVVEKIRKEDNKTPVLFLTAISEFDYRQQAIKNGADAYMSKPFMIRDLLDKVKELTSKGTEQQ